MTMTLLYSVYIFTILLMFYLVFRTVQIGSSKAASAFLCCDISLMMVIFGMLLEVIMGSTVEAALVCLKLQYVGQAIFLMSLLYFSSIFLHMSISKWIYFAQLCVNAVVLVGCMTAEDHRLFYSSARIVSDGLYPMIKVTDGPIWYLHYAHLGLVLFGVMAAAVMNYKKGSHRQKMRSSCLFTGIGVVAVELILKAAGVFGPFNPFVVATFVLVLCLYQGVFRYGYFDTVEAAKGNVLNLTTEGILVIDSWDRVMYLNAQMQKLFPELKTGESICASDVVGSIFDGRKEIRKNGVYYQADVSEVSEEELHDGKMLRLTDMTSYLKEMECLRKESEQKTDFLSRISHEIRTPLNTIKGMNEMIRKECTDSRILSYAEDIREAEKMLAALVGDILDITKIEKAEVAFYENEFSARGLFRKLWKAADLKCRKKNLALSFEIDEMLPVTWYSDEARLYQIMENLLSNAIKYTRQGSVRLVAGKTGAQELTVEVRDTGIGIPEESFEKIFHRFEQLQTKNRGQGLGLGLEITKNITERMGGQIRVESELGKGSSFFVTLPIEFASEEVIGADWKTLGETAQRERPVLSCEGRRILIVDDNEMNRRVIRNYLRDTGIIVEEAESGAACLEMLEKGVEYDLLFLDHMMPEMDGIELFHKITALPLYKKRPIPVIALTANAVKGAKQLYLAEGFDDYLTKPVDAEFLFSMIQEYLGGTLEYVSPNDGQEKKSLEIWTKLQEMGMDVETARHYADDSDAFLLEELKIFKKNCPEMTEGLLADLKSRDYKGARIKFHSLKNNFATLGFAELSAQAKELEEIAGGWETLGADQKETGKSKWEAFIGEYRELTERLSEAI